MAALKAATRGLSHTSGSVASRQMGGELVPRHRRRVEHEAIEQVLMHGIRHLDNDDAHRPGKRRVAHECDAKLVVEIAVVILAEAHDVR